MDIKTLFKNNFPTSTVEHKVTPSFEGFTEILAKMRKMLSASKPDIALKDPSYPSVKAFIDNRKRFVEEVTKTYLNDSWLKKQTLVEGNIKSGDFAHYLILDKKSDDLIGNLEEAKRRWDKFLAWYDPSLKHYDEEIRKIHKELIAGYNKIQQPTDGEYPVKEVNALFKEALDKVEKLKSPAAGFNLSNLSFLRGTRIVLKNENGDITLDTVRNKEMEEMRIDEVPALDRDGIKKVAKILIDVIKYDYFKHPYVALGTDHSDGGRWNRIFDHDNAVAANAYYEITYHQSISSKHWIDVLDTYNIVYALEHWLSRSIK